MKIFAIALLFIVLVALMLNSCSKEGEVSDRAKSTIKINGKEYRFIQVVPADGEQGVWLLVPKDVTIELPEITAHLVKHGKHYEMETALWVK